MSTPRLLSPREEVIVAAIIAKTKAARARGEAWAQTRAGARAYIIGLGEDGMTPLSVEVALDQVYGRGGGSDSKLLLVVAAAVALFLMLRKK